MNRRQSPERDVAAQIAERRHHEGPEREPKVFGFSGRQPQRSGDAKVFARGGGGLFVQRGLFLPRAGELLAY